jgi:hypothetical protein
MNIEKVRKSAAFVNYIKPEMEMVEMEVEESLLLTASGPGDVRFGAGVSGANSIPGAGNSGKWSSSDTGKNNLNEVSSGGRVVLK